MAAGRYDVVCPAKSAWDLHRAMPEAAFEIVGDSGHSANEPGTRGEHDPFPCKWRVSASYSGLIEPVARLCSDDELDGHSLSAVA